MFRANEIVAGGGVGLGYIRTKKARCSPNWAATTMNTYKTNLAFLGIVLVLSAVIAISLMNAGGVATLADPFSWNYTPGELHKFCLQYHDWYSKCQRGAK